MSTRSGKFRKPLVPAIALLLAPLACGLGSDTAAQHFESASRLAQQGRLAEATEEYRLGLALDPRSARAYNNLGALYFQERQFRAAADAFGHAHGLEPGDATISFNLGLALFDAGDPRSAVPHLAAGVKDSSHTLDAQYLLGACYFQLKQWTQSIAQLELARRSRPDDERILFLLTKDYRNVGKPSQSLEAAGALLQKHPDSPFVHEMLGEAYDTTSQPRKAEAEFRRAIAVSPQAPQLHFMLGYLYWRWKHYDKAVAPLEAEVRISPHFAPPYCYLGDIALRDGETEEAEEDFREALRLDPAYGEANLGLGRVLAALGQYEESIGFLRRAVERMPNRVEPHLWLGTTLMHMGRSKEGKEELAKVDEINRAKQRTASEMLGRALEPGPAHRQTGGRAKEQ